MKNIFVRTLAPVVFETITYPGIDGWCGREIIKKFNIIIQNSDKEMRHALIAENNLMHLCVIIMLLQTVFLFIFTFFNRCKLVDLLSVCGDYEYQLGIMECIFRMCSKQQIEEYSKDLIPEDENLLKAFLAINNETFYNDVRRFLNIVNEKTMGVYSVICEQVLLDGVSVSGPEVTLVTYCPGSERAQVCYEKMQTGYVFLTGYQKSTGYANLKKKFSLRPRSYSSDTSGRSDFSLFQSYLL